MDWTEIIVVLISTFSGGISVAWLSRRKTWAESEATISKTATDAAKALIDEYQEQARDNAIRHKAANDFLKNEIAELRASNTELKQDQRRIKADNRIINQSLENMQAQLMKYRLIISIFSMQIRSIGQEPMIHPDDIDTISIDDLTLIASGLSNSNRRREQISD